MDVVTGIVAVAAVAGGVWYGTNGEFDFNAQPSVFPPIDGPIALPDRAEGYFQNTGDEFLRQLSDAERLVWDGLDPNQRKRAALFIRNGGTLISSFGSDF